MKYARFNMPQTWGVVALSARCEMATFEQIMGAALNAERAGDTNAARALVQEAQKLRQGDDWMLPQVDAPGYDDPAPARRDRFGDTISKATEGPRQALGVYAGALAGGPSPTREKLPEGMDPSTAGRVALVGDAAMAGLSALGLAYSTGAGVVGEALGGSPTQEVKLARDLMMMGEVAAPELAGASGTIRATGRAVRAAEAGMPEATTDRQRQARAADDLGITPTLGMTGRTGATVAAQAEKLPIAGNNIAADAARFVGEAEAVFDRNVASVGPSTNAASAGATLQTGLNRFVDNFRGRSDELYSQVDALVPPDTRIEAPQTVALIREAVAPFESNPEIAARLGLTRWASLADDLEGGISWQAARDLRSSLGQAIGKINGPLADMDQGRLKRAYESLTADLDMAVQGVGPEAQQAWNRANQYYRAGSKRIQEQLDRSISADSPERAFEAFAAMTRDRSGQANSTRMLRIKNSLQPEEWAEISGTIVDRMGRTTPGGQNAAGDAFSPGTFLTNWNRMSDEAKRILLPARTREELTKLAEVAEAAKDAGAERNHSNTGTINAGLLVGLGAYTAPMTTAGIVTGATVTSKAMTSPIFLRAVNRAARGDMRQINAMANGNGPFRDDAMTILRLSAAEAAVEGSSANSPYAPMAQTTAR